MSCFNCSAPSSKNTTLVEGRDEVVKILQAVKMKDEYGMEQAVRKGPNPLIIKNACCKRAFLRGAFLSVGSMSASSASWQCLEVLTCLESSSFTSLEKDIAAPLIFHPCDKS